MISDATEIKLRKINLESVRKYSESKEDLNAVDSWILLPA